MRTARWQLTAGIIGPLIWVIGVLVATLAERRYLRSSGLSAVHRTPVEWPSILLLSSSGWLVSTLFVLTGLLALGFAAALYKVTAIPRSATAAVAVLGVAVAVVAIPPDAANASRSLHGHVHDWTYPLIPLAALACQLRLALLRQSATPLKRLWIISAAAAAVTVVALVVTNVDAVAQLARYVLFAAIAVWLGIFALLSRQAIVAAPGNTG